MVALESRCCGTSQRLEDGRCVGAPSQCARGLLLTPDGCVPPRKRVALAGGRLDLAPKDWEAQGLATPRSSDIAGFRIDAHEVTESRYLPCVAADVCPAVASWGEPGRPVSGLTRDEATTFCTKWAGGRLPTLDQLAFAAAGAAGRRYPWGATGAVCRRAAWGLRSGLCAEGATGPEIAGSHPDGHSPQGIADLAGNVAEWTQTVASDLTPGAEPIAVIFGGSYAHRGASALRSWYRQTAEASSRRSAVGFRCVYGPEPAAAPTEHR